jgi:hypothetical protein
MVDIAFLHNTFRSSPLENLTMWRNFSTGHKRVLIPCCVCVGWWWRPGIIDVWSPLSVSLALTPTSMPSKPPDCFIFFPKGVETRIEVNHRSGALAPCVFFSVTRERERGHWTVGCVGNRSLWPMIMPYLHWIRVAIENVVVGGMRKIVTCSPSFLGLYHLFSSTMEHFWFVINIRFIFFQQTQRPEQSVMQALESLNDSQVNIYIYSISFFLQMFIGRKSRKKLKQTVSGCTVVSLVCWHIRCDPRNGSLVISS